MYNADKKISEYIVYENKTGLPVFIGPARKCAEYMGITLPSMYCQITRIKSGEITQGLKYTVYKIEDDEEG